MGGNLARAWRTARRPSAGVAALLLLTAANAVQLRQTGCPTNSHVALVRAIDLHGELTIDRYQWQTCDKSFDRGHFYSNKAPGLAFVGVPVYGALAVVGVVGEHLPSQPSLAASGDDLRGITWPLTLFGAVLPILLLLLLVRRLGDEVAPGYGTATAMTLGVGTLVLPFTATFFQHALSATLGFAAFALLWLERRGPPRLLLVGAAAAVSAYAASVEYPLGLATVVLGVYAVARSEQPLRRAAAYIGGGLVGILPLLIYNRFAFGSITHLSYVNQVRNQGQTGHDTIGAQAAGLYGVTSPRLHQALFLLFGHKGLLVLGPVMALGVIGLVLLWRRGYRAETLVCTIVPLGFLGYNSGFPIGGDVPGPRYLIPMLPFLAVPLALVWRRAPLTTLALTAGSAVSMVAATVTGGPWGGPGYVWGWFSAIGDGNLTQTVLTPLGAGHGWLALSPFIVFLAGSIVLAVRATPRPRVVRRDAEIAVSTIVAWMLVAGSAPSLLDAYGTDVDGAVLAAVAAAAAVVWAVARWGLWSLLAAAPMAIVLAPSLADRPGAVAAAAGVTLLLIAMLALLRSPRVLRKNAVEPTV